MRENEANGEVTCGKDKTSHLNCWIKSGGERKNEGKRKRKKEKREEEKRSEKLLLSTFYENWTVGFHRGKRQSSTTLLELRVGTRIQGFCQTLIGRGFSPTRFNSCLRAI